MIDIDVTNFHPFGLYVWNAERVAIWWGDAPGDEPPGKPNAKQKWAMLRRWRESIDHQRLPEGDYLAFNPTEVCLACVHAGRPHKIKKKDK